MIQSTSSTTLNMENPTTFFSLRIALGDPPSQEFIDFDYHKESSLESNLISLV